MFLDNTIPLNCMNYNRVLWVYKFVELNWIKWNETKSKIWKNCCVYIKYDMLFKMSR